jgi:hypothetical protein
VVLYFLAAIDAPLVVAKHIFVTGTLPTVPDGPAPEAAPFPESFSHVRRRPYNSASMLPI